MIKKSIKEQIMEYFFINPSSKMRVRHIEKNLNLSLPSVINSCKQLKEEGILKTLIIGNVTFYTSDRTNKNYLLKKIFFNITQLIDSGLIDYLKKELSNPAVVLFGSYSRGEDIESSDIDLYVETVSHKKLNMDRYQEFMQRNIHILSYTNLDKIKNKYLVNNIINGVVLNNKIRIK